MANTVKSAKRARQADRRREQNKLALGLTKSVLKTAFDSLKTKDPAKVKVAYAAAVRQLARAASSHTIPKNRSARKVSRLTQLIQKTLPAALK